MIYYRCKEAMWNREQRAGRVYDMDEKNLRKLAAL